MCDLQDVAVRHAVDHRDAAAPGVRIDALEQFQSPRDGRRLAVQLLVEVVAQPSDGLRRKDRRGDRVADGRQLDSLPTAAEPSADCAERHRAPDAEPTVPDLEYGRETFAVITEVPPPVGEDVVDPTTDQSEGNGDQRDVEDVARLAAAGLPTAVAPPHGDDDADDDAERVRAERDRPEIPHALRRAR